MGLIRLLFLLLILGLLWFMAKNYLQKQELRRRREQPPTKLSAERVVRCKHCDVHLPEQEAVRDGDDWFCTPAHRQAWLTRSTRQP